MTEGWWPKRKPATTKSHPKSLALDTNTVFCLFSVFYLSSSLSLLDEFLRFLFAPIPNLWEEGRCDSCVLIHLGGFSWRWLVSVEGRCLRVQRVQLLGPLGETPQIQTHKLWQGLFPARQSKKNSHPFSSHTFFCWLIQAQNLGGNSELKVDLVHVDIWSTPNHQYKSVKSLLLCLPTCFPPPQFLKEAELRRRLWISSPKYEILPSAFSLETAFWT